MCEPAVKRFLGPLPHSLCWILVREPLQHCSPRVLNLVGVRFNFHPVGNLSGAGRNQMRLPTHLHQAETAHADGLEACIVAKRRHRYACGPARVKNCRAVRCFDRSTVNFQVYHDAPLSVQHNGTMDRRSRKTRTTASRARFPRALRTVHASHDPLRPAQC